jgi:hypothetical protein
VFAVLFWSMDLHVILVFFEDLCVKRLLKSLYIYIYIYIYIYMFVVKKMDENNKVMHASISSLTFCVCSPSLLLNAATRSKLWLCCYERWSRHEWDIDPDLDTDYGYDKHILL